MDETINKSKENLISEIERRVEDKIIERSNADLIIKLINNSDCLSEAIAIAQLGTTYKRTGFHFDKRLEKMDNTIKYFKKNEKLSFVNGDDGITHKLIIGENYDSLLNLLIEYNNMIDIVYIDPPYGKDDLGEFATTNYENSITRDNLLSMLYSRITLAKQLMNEHGVFFVSIDDKNEPYVKCLCNEIFGENNYISTLHWKKKKQPSYLHNQVASVMEYILVYAKNRNSMDTLSLSNPSDSNTRVDNANNQLSERIIPAGIRVKLDSSVEVIQAGKYKNKTMTTEFLDDVYIKDGRTINKFRAKAHFRDSQDRINKFCNNDVLFITKNYGFRRDKLQEELERRKAITDLLLDWGDNQDAEKELKDIFDSRVFDYPKPTSLIKNLIKSTGYDDAIVLDFFAGTGTTAHAVLQLNKEDNGSRQFILCTNNEITELNPNGIAYDVTSKRVKRIMSGECYDGNKNFEWIKSNEAYGDNLGVYEIEKVANFESSELKTPFEVIDETLYGREKFSTIEEKINWVCSNFENTQKVIETDKEWQERLED